MLLADRYELDELPLGKGGMGAVHAGHDKHLGRRVAVKFLHLPGGADDELERRFVREARILARLEHPGAPVLYDFGTTASLRRERHALEQVLPPHESHLSSSRRELTSASSGQPPSTGSRMTLTDARLFQVMQFIEGVTIADLVGEHGPLPVPWAAAIAAQACAVLCAAHELSICHRDLKPTNLMLCPDGSVKVLDFGLAILREADVAQFTRAGQLLGTPAYMAPEQIQRGAAGPRGDLYALGCVLHEMLTGSQLFTGPTAYAVLDRQVNERPGEVPGAPAELNRLLGELLAKDPDDRPADASTLYERLRPFARSLPPLPGFLHPASVPNPGRMYARVVGGELSD